LRQQAAGLRRAIGIASDPQPAGPEAYLSGGRVPWSPGYITFRNQSIVDTLSDEHALSRFRSDLEIPPGHGYALDERTIEYPWVFARSDTWGATVIDAGGTLTVAFLKDHAALAGRRIVTYDLEPPTSHDAWPRFRVSGDLRAIALRDGIADTIVCISTLDHIGMDNTRLYTRRHRYRENRRFDYRLAMGEMHRILKPGGRLHLTVPFGREQQLGWMQQFDEIGLDDIVRAFGGEADDVAFFRHASNGWIRSDAAGCRDATYFDVHASRWHPGLPAAAEAVACVTLRAKA
jgi:hypothetical protein